MMNIYLGADHRGVEYKKKISAILLKAGYKYQDLGAYDSEQPCDYPQIAYKVAKEVSRHKNSRGILVCMSGIGQAIAANKVKGVYAALCYNLEAARLSRQHNNANVLVLSAKFVEPRGLKKIILTWLTTEFEGGRHQRRFDQIKQIERKG